MLAGIEQEALRRADELARYSAQIDVDHGREHRVQALVTGLEAALRADVVRARDALRAKLGDVQLIEENGAVYAECDNAAERLLLAVGGVSMSRVAGEGFEPSTFGL